MRVEGAFCIVARSEDDSGGGGAVGGGGPVYGVDVVDEEVVVGEGGEEDAAFDVPGYWSGNYWIDVSTYECADAVDFSTKASGVVFVVGEAEVGVVEVVGGGCLIVGVEGGVDGAADEGLGFGVCGGDLDFLESEDVRPFPAAEAGSEGGLGGGWL